MTEQVKKEKTKQITLKWFVVRAISGQEKKVKQYIEVEINRLKLGDYVAQVLIPTEKIIQIRNGKKVAKERSFYPGYVLRSGFGWGDSSHHKKFTGCYRLPGRNKRRRTRSDAPL